MRQPTRITTLVEDAAHRRGPLAERGLAFWIAACLKPDSIPDDQALYFASREGIVIILGCAHAGVVNTLRYICEFSGGKSDSGLLHLGRQESLPDI